VTTTHLVEAAGLRRSYRARGLGSAGPMVKAIDGIDLVVDKGEALGVVGGSGAGKSTLVRLLLGLESPDEGVVRFDGHVISAGSERSIRELRRRFQPVFQDSLAALDPRMRIEDAVAEPLAALGIGDAEQRRMTVVDLLRQVDLPVDVMRRYPAALSGGERQRVAIARALAPEPELLILDEPVSSLDATVALQVMDLLRELGRRRALTLVLVTHDVRVVREICDRVVVMRAGKIVEEGNVAAVFDAPEHEYTRQLLAALPKLKL